MLPLFFKGFQELQIFQRLALVLAREQAVEMLGALGQFIGGRAGREEASLAKDFLGGDVKKRSERFASLEGYITSIQGIRNNGVR